MLVILIGRLIFAGFIYWFIQVVHAIQFLLIPYSYAIIRKIKDNTS